jgi:hypothetical protein
LFLFIRENPTKNGREREGERMSELHYTLFNVGVCYILAAYGGMLIVHAYRRRDGDDDLIGWKFGVGTMLLYLALKWI